MRAYVVTGNIRDELLVAIGLTIENETELLFLERGSVAFAAEEDAEFERHVEARELIDRIKPDFRDVVNAKLALFDDALNLREPNIARVIRFTCTASYKAKIMDREHNGVKDRGVSVVKRTVDEDVVRLELRHEADGGC